MFNRAVKAFKSIGAIKTTDYLTILHNLSLAYGKREMFEKYHKIYQMIFKLYDEKSMDSEGSFRKLFTSCYLRTLLEDERYAEAVNFATEEDRRNMLRFGENSIQRIDFLLQVGSYLKAYGIEFCINLYKMPIMLLRPADTKTQFIMPDCLIILVYVTQTFIWITILLFAYLMMQKSYLK